MTIKKKYTEANQSVGKHEHETKNQHQALTFWLTGLSGSGKSTIAKGLERMLFNEGFSIRLIDGDIVRLGLCSDLTFDMKDRKENIRRAAELSKLFNDTGIITINSFISPTRAIRSMAEKIIGSNSFFEIYVNTPIELCEKRDVKGLYDKARKGLISNFTGITSPYEPPLSPDLQINTEEQSEKQSINVLREFVLSKVNQTYVKS